MASPAKNREENLEEALDPQTREDLLFRFLQLRRKGEKLKEQSEEAFKEAKALQTSFPFIGNCLGFLRKKSSQKKGAEEAHEEEWEEAPETPTDVGKEEAPGGNPQEAPKAPKKKHPIQRKPSEEEIRERKKQKKSSQEILLGVMGSMKASPIKEFVNPNLPSSYGK